MAKNQQNISDKIREAIEEYHKRKPNLSDPYALLSDKQLLNAYLKDSLGRTYSEDPILGLAVNNANIGSILHDAIGKSSAKQQSAYDRAVDSVMHLGRSWTSSHGQNS